MIFHIYTSYPVAQKTLPFFKIIVSIVEEGFIEYTNSNFSPTWYTNNDPPDEAYYYWILYNFVNLFIDLLNLQRIKLLKYKCEFFVSY